MAASGYDLLDALPTKTKASVVDASADSDAAYMASLYPNVFKSQEPAAPLPPTLPPIAAPQTRSNMGKYIMISVIMVVVLAAAVYMLRRSQLNKDARARAT